MADLCVKTTFWVTSLYFFTKVPEKSLCLIGSLLRLVTRALLSDSNAFARSPLSFWSWRLWLPPPPDLFEAAAADEEDEGGCCPEALGCRF